MGTEIIYIYEKMDSHLFWVVNFDGQIVDEVDILSAEGFADRMVKKGFEIQWIDRSPSLERKYVRNLISQHSACYAGCACPVGVSV